MDKIKILAFIAFLLVTPKFLQTEYTKTLEVVEVVKPCIEYPDGLVKCDKKISFEGSDDWLPGDIVEITFNDNGSAFTTEDDFIIKTLYKGYIY